MTTEGWNETKRQRRDIAVELFKEVAPRRESDAKPKGTLFALVEELWAEEKEMRKERDPFLLDHSDFFISAKTLMSYWPDMKAILAQEGLWVGYVRGRDGGVFLTRGKLAIAKAAAADLAIIEASAERYRHRYELANKKRNAQIPLPNIALLPSVTEDDESDS